MSTLSVFLPIPTDAPHHDALDTILRLRAAVEVVGYHHETRDGHLRAVPNAAIRVVAPGFGHGILVSITNDERLELQLDGEHRRDEYLPCQVQLETSAS